MSQTGYTDITPKGGFLPGRKKLLGVNLKDAAEAGVTAQDGNLTLDIYAPISGAQTQITSGFTDAGSGNYTYRYEFAEEGQYFGVWTFDDGTRKLVTGFKLKTSNLVD